MDFKVRSVGYYLREFRVIDNGTTVDSGFLRGSEITDLAASLRRAAYELDDIEFVTKESAEAAIEEFVSDDEDNDAQITAAKTSLVDA